MAPTAHVAGDAVARLVEGERIAAVDSRQGGLETGGAGTEDGYVGVRFSQGLSPQNFEAARSLAGRISRQVVHQPERIVSTNSSGSSSTRISRASA